MKNKVLISSCRLKYFESISFEKRRSMFCIVHSTYYTIVLTQYFFRYVPMRCLLEDVQTQGDS